MTYATRKFFLAALLATAGVAAVAQPAPGAGPGAMAGQGPMAHGMGPGMGPMGHGRPDPAQREARRAQRLNEFKTVLQITPAQEPAWAAFTAALKPPANAQRPNREEIAKLPTPERIDRMRALHAERQAMMDKRADATKTFYAQLTPEQKKSFDVISARMMGGHRGGHGGPGMHRG